MKNGTPIIAVTIPMGKSAPGTIDLEITDETDNIAAPHKADNAGRTWLELDPERCKKEIQKANALGLRLIGYWHTHPQVIPQISSADISSFSRFAQRYSQVLPHPVAIIVGTSPDTSGIKAWLFREGGYFEAVRMDCPF